jgi:8-oxo-dGTP diphosphatase
MARSPVLAAGGIVLRQARPPQIAVVRLRKGNEWVLPKGKLDDGETARDAAMREVLEETGHDVSVHEFLGTLAYEAGGRSKIVHYWRMETNGKPTRDLMHDVTAVDWLPLNAAVERLSRDHERAFLANVGPLALEAARRARERKAAAIEKPAAEKPPRRRRAVAPKPAPVAPAPVPSAPMAPLANDAATIERRAVQPAAIEHHVIEESPPLLGGEAIDAGVAEDAPEMDQSEAACSDAIVSEGVGPDALPALEDQAVNEARQGRRSGVMQRVRSWLRRAG